MMPPDSFDTPRPVTGHQVQRRSLSFTPVGFGSPIRSKPFVLDTDQLDGGPRPGRLSLLAYSLLVMSVTFPSPASAEGPRPFKARVTAQWDNVFAALPPSLG